LTWGLQKNLATTKQFLKKYLRVNRHSCATLFSSKCLQKMKLRRQCLLLLTIMPCPIMPCISESYQWWLTVCACALDVSDMGVELSERVSCQKSKRMRTSFKHHQLRSMQSFFTHNHNPDAKDLKELSQKTGLTKRVLQVRKTSLGVEQNDLCLS